MKPAAFDYIRPTSLSDALAILAEQAGNVAILAGGQSLMPLLNFRLARPEIVMDINAIPELQEVRHENGALRIGAMVRHRRVEEDEIFQTTIPLMSEAMNSVAHLQIKTRGTLGGNLCNAHPASEMPAVITALGATMICRSAERGERVLSAEQFFESSLQNSLEDDELLCEIRVPVPAPHIGWAFEEISRRHGDFALCGAAVLIGVSGQTIDYARIGLCSVDVTPVRFEALEQWLIGRTLDGDLPEAIELKCRESLAVEGDAAMTGENKTKLASVVISKAVMRAVGRAVRAVEKKS